MGNKKENKEKFVHDIYIGKEGKITIITVLFIILILLGIYSYLSINKLIDKSFNKYIEQSKINYQVLYNNGTVIDNNQNNTFDSNSINKIDLDLNYIFNSKMPINNYYDYKIIGSLKIKDKNKVLYQKDYNFQSSKLNIIKNNMFDINESISFDYAYYHHLSNGLKQIYNLNSNAVYEIKLVVNNGIKDNNKILISIPLNNGKVTIEKKCTNRVDNYINADKFLLIENIIIVIAMVIVLIVLLLFICYSFKQYKLENTMSDYEKKIKRILGTYDRMIVNISVMPDLDDYKVNKVNEFKELLDVANSYNEPIRFIEVESKKKANFIVRHKDEIFIYSLKK